MQFFNQMRWYFIIEWKRYISSIFLLIVIAILQLLPPKFIGILIDNIIIKKQNGRYSLYWIGLILLTSIAVYGLRYAWRILLFGAAYQLAIVLRIKLYKFLSKKNANFYYKYRTGDLMARATNDIDKVVFAAGEGVLTLIDSTITGISVLIMMIVQINWTLTIVSLLPMPIMAIIITQYGKKLYVAFQKAQETFSDLNNQSQECLTNIYMVKSFGLEEYEIKKFNKIAQNTSIKNIVVSKIDAKFDPTIYFAIMLSNLLSLSLGGYLVWNNYITIGQLTSFIMYSSLMVWPMLALAWMFNIVERGNAAWDRIHKIVNNNFLYKSGKQKIQTNKKNINIKILQFNYLNNIQPTLKNIFIKIKFNKIIGFCGPTGSGKSTLLNLLQKNFEIIKGNICYNTQNINDFRLKDWRKKISVVNQSTFLFSDTIKNNIALGKMNATQEDIEYVSKLAHIHKNIINFPQGYQTKIGENGIILSGGQKQRITIARALLLNTEILILDNALSAIDRPTQHIILQNLKKWKKSYHTIIVVSHDLYTLKYADNIFVMQNGTIMHQGTHHELKKYDNWYQKMYHCQKINRII